MPMLLVLRPIVVVYLKYSSMFTLQKTTGLVLLAIIVCFCTSNGIETL